MHKNYGSRPRLVIRKADLRLYYIKISYSQLLPQDNYTIFLDRILTCIFTTTTIIPQNFCEALSSLHINCFTDSGE